MGCRYAEVGHAERRRLFGEDDAAAAAKVAASWRNGLTPVLCVGEAALVPSADAARACVSEAEAILGRLPGPSDSGTAGLDPASVILAYERTRPSASPRPPRPAHIAASHRRPPSLAGESRPGLARQSKK